VKNAVGTLFNRTASRIITELILQWFACIVCALGLGGALARALPRARFHSLPSLFLPQEYGRAWGACPVKSEAAYRARGSFPLPPTAVASL
jgi:hypothetical protein